MAAGLRSADDVFADYIERRKGILRALTVEVENFYAQCDPARENLCLYGYGDGTWEVALPCEEVPPELPEPALGINFARDGMRREDWLCLVAVHSDSWLMSVAFFNGARLDASGRRRLFVEINRHPSCYEVVSGRVAAPGADGGGGAAAYGGGVKRPAGSAPGGSEEPGKRRAGARTKYTEYGEGEEEEEENGGFEDNPPCPNCGRTYKTGDFWIQCDFCDRWYDGKCVSMTAQRAERQPQWKCPFCVTAGNA